VPGGYDDGGAGLKGATDMRDVTRTSDEAFAAHYLRVPGSLPWVSYCDDGVDRPRNVYG